MITPGPPSLTPSYQGPPYLSLDETGVAGGDNDGGLGRVSDDGNHDQTGAEHRSDHLHLLLLPPAQQPPPHSAGRCHWPGAQHGRRWLGAAREVESSPPERGLW